MVLRYLVFPLILMRCGLAVGPNQAVEIVRRSVTNTQADWNAAPQYDFTERDVGIRNGKRTVKTYSVMMIEGSPYNKLIAVNNEPLPAAQAAEEEQKLRRHRRSSPGLGQL